MAAQPYRFSLEISGMHAPLHALHSAYVLQLTYYSLVISFLFSQQIDQDLVLATATLRLSCHEARGTPSYRNC